MYQSVPIGTADGNVGLSGPTTREGAGYLYPTPNECLLEILHQARHSSVVEYFLDHSKHGFEDSQRPHDLVGEGNKFDHRVMRYLPLEYRKPKVDLKIILRGVEIHQRGQEHHRRVNGYKLSPDATEDFLLEGMLDVACAIRENRIYAPQKAHSYDDVLEIFTGRVQPPHKISFMRRIIGELKDLERAGFPWPNLELITFGNITGDNLIPNYFGLHIKPINLHDAIDKRVKWAVAMLRSGGYQRAWEEMDRSVTVN